MSAGTPEAGRRHRVTAEVLAEVHTERQEQDFKWGEQNHPDGTTFEDVDLANKAREACDSAFKHGQGTWSDILMEEVMEVCAEEDPGRLRTELVQVAAVAVAWVEAIDRRTSR